MTIDKLLKVRIAMKQGKSKDYVRYKLDMYMKDYLEKEHDVIDKCMHQELMFDYTNYIRRRDIK
jgi:hypothetical protein